TRSRITRSRISCNFFATDLRGCTRIRVAKNGANTMSRTSWLGSIITMQLVNALLVFAFSIYLGVTAYPLVAFFQEREVTATYVLDVAVFVTLGLLVLVGWSSLGEGNLWAWWFAVA